MSERPDILVLGGGGRQGDAWMTGMLAALEDTHGFDLRECDYFVGTSAGAVIAAKLAGGQSLTRPPSYTSRPASGGQSPLPAWAAHSAMAIAAPFAQLGLRLGRPAGELVRGAALRAMPTAASGALNFDGAFPADRARFDGRLRLVAVDRATGRRVVFGAPGAPAATVAQALTASCSVPLLFPPAVIDGHAYVDGAIWSPTNADVAPATRDMRVLILAPMASLHGPWSAPARVAAQAAMLTEASALKARGARIRILTPDRASAVAIGRDLMSDADVEGTQAAGYAQGLGVASLS